MTSNQIILFLTAATLLLSGCGKKEINKYTVKKEPQPAPMMPAAEATSPPGSRAIAYETPEGWTDIGGSGMRVAAFEAGEVSTTIIPLPGNAGTLLGNINRWRGQVGLEPVAEDKLETTDVQIAGSAAHRVELEGPEQAMTAAILERDGTQWFFKMMGPAAEVKAQNTAFDAFLQSISFP